MPDAQKKADAADKAVETFLNGKYKTKAEFEDAYANLEKKLGEQGGELGTLRKKSDEYSQQLAQYQQWVNQVNPTLQWLQQNYADLQKWDQARQTKPQSTQTLATSLLTREEQDALISQAVERANAQSQAYFNQHLQAAIDQKSREFQDILNQRESTSAKLYWDMLEKSLPKDKVEYLKQRNQETLRFADPSKHDPMKAADEFVSMREQLAALQKERDDLKKAHEEAQKRAVPSLGASRSLFKKPEVPAETGGDRDSRFKSVMSDLTNKFGGEVHDVLTNG